MTLALWSLGPLGHAEMLLPPWTRQANAWRSRSSSQVSSGNRRFAAAGFVAVGVSVGLSGLHTPADTPNRVEPEALHQTGTLLLATIWQLAYGAL